MTPETVAATEEHEIVRRRRWLLLAFFCVINFCTGALYLWSIFSAPLAARLAHVTGSTLSAADLSPVFGLAGGLTPFLMIAGGFVNDRFGPKWVISAGGAAIAIGYWIASFATDTTLLYLGYGLFVGAGTGLVNGCTINTSVKLFPDRRGFAGGLVTASLGVGAALLPFAATALIEGADVITALRVFGTVSGIVIVPLALMTRRVPAGFMTDRRAEGSSAARTARDKNWVEMLRTPSFWPLAFLFMTSATMGLMIISNLSGIAQTQVGLTAAAAATAVSVLSIANTAGRFLSGTLSDALGRIPALLAALACAVAGFLFLMLAGEGDAWKFFIGITGIGLCFGAFVGIYPGLVADEYGAAHNSVNLSILFLGYSLGGLIGPVLVRWSAGTGDFTAAYLTSIGLAAAGFVFAAAYVLLSRRERTAAAGIRTACPGTQNA